MKFDEGNPWSVGNASVFLKYCCPECEYSHQNLNKFTGHALKKHHKSKVLFDLESVDENIKSESDFCQVEKFKQDEKNSYKCATCNAESEMNRYHGTNIQ